MLLVLCAMDIPLHLDYCGLIRMEYMHGEEYPCKQNPDLLLLPIELLAGSLATVADAAGGRCTTNFGNATFPVMSCLVGML